ncbi:MAG TPA: hypothetical protein VL983_08920 [Terriglobales bacterium]|nr:hypothetical protein [Terriglobales bacterium]
MPTRRSFGHSLLFLILAVALFVFAVTPAKAQVPRLETKNGHQFATVVFMRSFWSGHPQYYSIAIDSVGDAAYECSPRLEQQTGVPYMVQFHASASMRERTFNLAQQLKFFQLSDSEVQSSGSPNYYVAENQSKNTLEFREGTTDNSISYHESRNTLIQQITSLFEGMENTLQFGRNLTYLSRNRSPELATQLKRMQDMAAQGKLLEVQAAAPTLENIASDESLSQVARQRAKALLKSAAAEIATP